MTTEKEPHPYLPYFDPSRQMKYLILGSFPPNFETREKFFIKYFYGNSTESIWNILKKTGLFEITFLDIHSIQK